MRPFVGVGPRVVALRTLSLALLNNACTTKESANCIVIMAEQEGEIFDEKRMDEGTGGEKYGHSSKADRILGVDHDHAVVDITPVVKDGMKLHPQPTSDPLDPLNWSSARKNSILAIVMAL